MGKGLNKIHPKWKIPQILNVSLCQIKHVINVKKMYLNIQQIEYFVLYYNQSPYILIYNKPLPDIITKITYLLVKISQREGVFRDYIFRKRHSFEHTDILVKTCSYIARILHSALEYYYKWISCHGTELSWGTKVTYGCHPLDSVFFYKR